MRLKQGTWSVLFGCHSAVHSLLVLIAWARLYRRSPNWWQIVCILIHDIGHWGKDYLDNEEEKRKHWRAGSMLALRLFGRKGLHFVAGHDRYSGFPESELLKPDKYSWHIAPVWWLLSNQIFEPKLKMGYSRMGAVKRFKDSVRRSIESGKYRPTHDMYIDRGQED